MDRVACFNWNIMTRLFLCIMARVAVVNSDRPIEPLAYTHRRPKGVCIAGQIVVLIIVVVNTTSAAVSLSTPPACSGTRRCFSCCCRGCATSQPSRRTGRRQSHRCLRARDLRGQLKSHAGRQHVKRAAREDNWAGPPCFQRWHLR